MRNSTARDEEDEEAAATIVWRTSLTSRRVGSVRRSLEKALRKRYISNGIEIKIGIGFGVAVRAGIGIGIGTGKGVSGGKYDVLAAIPPVAKIPQRTVNGS